MARFTFFVGKGGVGKTTVSSAYALHRAATEPRQRVLLLSVDPAHSLADVLQAKVGDRTARLHTAGRLWARQLDADKQIKRFLAGERDELLAVLSKGSLFTRAELEPLLDTSLPGMSEVAALLAVHELLDSDYDEVIVDTAPMGHAIRLFQMPEHFARFLDVLESAAARDEVLAKHFGGRAPKVAALDRWARLVQEVEHVFSASRSRLVLVTTPEPFSLNEAVRSGPALRAGTSQSRIGEIVLNRAVTSADRCPRCRRRVAQTKSAQEFLHKRFPSASVFVGEDPGCPILGLAALRAFGGHVFEGRVLPRSVLSSPPKSRPLRMLPLKWPELLTPLTLTLGKGGVGKTTVSAALAVHQRKTARRNTVTICSIDPAPSLDDVFQSDVGDEPGPVLHDRKLLAAEFDAVAQFESWTDALRARLKEAMTASDRGVHIDVSLDRKFLLALLDVVPPGIDEIFAIFRILDLLQSGSPGSPSGGLWAHRTDSRVVIDMAPTGHALEVLETPERLLAWSRLLLKTLAHHRGLAMARDAAVEIATVSQNVRELANILRDARRSTVFAVTLPEPLPNYETRRLLRALRSLRAPVRAIFVNRVLPPQTGSCTRCRLQQDWQAFSLSQIRREVGSLQLFVANEFESPIAGERALKRFTQQLHRLS